MLANNIVTVLDQKKKTPEIQILCFALVAGDNLKLQHSKSGSIENNVYRFVT